jgi:uncharacterized protein YcfJ
MRPKLLAAGLALAVTIPALAPSAATARSYCEQRAHDRRVTGTVLGGLGGALIGGAISHHGTGALLGGVAGAVAGNQLARTSCDHYAYRRTYRERYARRSYGPVYGSPGYAPVACRYESRPYYDARGQLVYAPTQVCR